jgi:hypothetical protein
LRLLENATLGYDYESANSDFFYTKLMEVKNTTDFKFKYPLLAYIEFDHRVKNIFINQETQVILYDFKIMLLDVFKNETSPQEDLDRRLQGQVYFDTDMTLRKLLDYFTYVQFVKVTKGANQWYAYENTKKLDLWITKSKIDSYQTETVNNSLSKTNQWFRTTLESANSDGVISRITPKVNHNVCGSTVNFKFESCRCISDQFNYDVETQDLIHG